MEVLVAGHSHDEGFDLVRVKVHIAGVGKFIILSCRIHNMKAGLSFLYRARASWKTRGLWFRVVSCAVDISLICSISFSYWKFIKY